MVNAATTKATPRRAGAMAWTGRVLSGLSVLFLLFDAGGKFAKPAQVVDAFGRLAVPLSLSMMIGALLLVCTVLYAIPRTAILGAVLLTGYLGGAVAIHLRAGSSVFESIFPVLFAGLAWLGLYLRDPGLRRMLPVRR